MGNLLADVRHSVRVLAKSPGFTIVAVLALALGIGGNAAIFSVIDRVLLRPLPFPDSERMMAVARHYPNGDADSVSIPKFMAWRQCHAFQSIAAYDFGVAVNMGSADRPEPVNALHVSSGFFDVFGVSPILGRTFTPEEDLPNAGKFVVLTFGAWKNRLGGDAGVVGKPVLLNAEPYTVLGVLPEAYEPDPPAELYLPAQFDPASTNQGNIYSVVGRLRPEASAGSAQAELNVIQDAFRASHPDIADKSEGVGVRPQREMISGDIRPALLVLAGAVSFVLLMACANVANLLLARAADRRRELAIRTAVGANRRRIVMQLLTESLMLALAGGVAGLAVGEAGVRLLLAFSPGNIPRINATGHATAAISMLDWRVLVFLVGISLITGVIFGLFPAIQVSRLDVNSALKESSSRSGTGLKHNRVRGVLVVSEIALALILLVGAALMIRTFASLRSVKTGFDASNVLTMRTSLSGARYGTTAQVASMTQQAMERIEGLPGVAFAACTVVLPGQMGLDLPFSIEGRAPKINGKWEGDEQWRFASPHYFDALRIPVLRGRAIDRRDTGQSPRVVIVNDAFAKKYFPNEDPLGHQLLIGRGIGPDFEEPVREIVGVVGSTTERGLANGLVPAMYVPEPQVKDNLTKLANGLLPLTWVIRANGDPLAIAPAVRRVFDGIDAQLAPSRIQTMERVMSDSTRRENFNMLLLSVFAGVALLLAAIGIYGLMSYAVQQRTQEIGIRMALGAGRGRMMRLIMGQGMRLAAIGIVVGLGAAYGLTRFLAGLLFNVTATDPWTFALVAGILSAVALVAAFVPAHRATRIDPVLALRQE
ncbi:MAG TPA: ABC transporter permease [Bryobacteraceae bacterium]|nr:ABC transporter permease [Bryobacteraceae bacterium]